MVDNRVFGWNLILNEVILYYFTISQIVHKGALLKAPLQLSVVKSSILPSVAYLAYRAAMCCRQVVTQ